eukprot:Awhi_evm1s792
MKVSSVDNDINKENVINIPCRAFILKGSCNFGLDCKFVHCSKENEDNYLDLYSWRIAGFPKETSALVVLQATFSALFGTESTSFHPSYHQDLNPQRLSIPIHWAHPLPFLPSDLHWDHPLQPLLQDQVPLPFSEHCSLDLELMQSLTAKDLRSALTLSLKNIAQRKEVVPDPVEVVEVDDPSETVPDVEDQKEEKAVDEPSESEYSISEGSSPD